MIRLRPLRPREKRNLRHWAMEFAIVVVGVLIALWAQEWVEQKRETKRHEQVMDSLHREILITQALAARPVMAQDCVARQFDTLRDMLEQDDPYWPGLVAPGSIGLGQGMAGPIIFPTNLYSTQSYLRARETGALEQYPDEIELAYEEIFYTFDTLRDASRGIDEAVSALRPLATARPIDAATRLEMLQHLARFDQYRMSHFTQVGYLATQSKRVGMQVDEKRLGYIGEWLAVEQLAEQYGDCVKDIDWTTGKAVARQETAR